MLIIYGDIMKKNEKPNNSIFYSSLGLSSISQLFNDTSDNYYLRMDDSTLVEEEADFIL